MNQEIKKSLIRKWSEYRQQKKWLNQFPDQLPVLLPSKKLKKETGIFFYQPEILDYETITDALFTDKNSTFKNNFIWYTTQLFSELSHQFLEEDGSIQEKNDGKEMYSLSLKKINRNYALFNQKLNQLGLLEVRKIYDVDLGKCIRYGLNSEVVKKGIRKKYLSADQVKKLGGYTLKSILPDKTSDSNPEVVEYFLEILRQTKISKKNLDGIEIEFGRFQRMYPSAKRFMDGKYDARLGQKEGRFHANYTYAHSEFRGLMRYLGKHQFVEGDVAACHFHFLLGEIADPAERKNMVEDLKAIDPYLEMCGSPSGVSRAELKQSSHIFKFGSRKSKHRYRSGIFYRHLAIKYPKFAAAMAAKPITHKKHKSDFACAVMRREAAVMVHAVGTKCMTEGLVYLPIHDGFLTLPDQFDRVCEIVTEAYLDVAGSIPRIRRK